MKEKMAQPGREGRASRGWLLVTYLGPLCLWPLLREVSDREVRWHARHGLVLLLVELLLAVGFLAVAAGVSFLLGPAALVFAFVGTSGVVAVLVLHGALTIAALCGESYRIPGVTHFVDRF